jgi:hypothetical protein
MKFTLNDFEVGDYVSYSTWGSTEIRKVYVERKFDDGAKQGFEGFLVDSQNNRVLYLNGDKFGVWGYTDQILRVEKENADA